MQAPPDVLMFGDTARSADIRHVVPVFMRDAFIYVEHDGRRFAYVNAFDAPLLSSVSGLSVDSFDSLGMAEIRSSGLSARDALMEVAARACHLHSVEQAAVPIDFPLEVGDYLRAHGIELETDRQFFEDRRRRKLEWQIEGIRRAQRAAEAAMHAIREMLRESRGVTSEELRREGIRALVGHGMTYDVMTVSHGSQSAIPHHRGEGAIEPGEPVLMDIFPRDPRSGCWADITRTFTVGTSSAELVAYRDACLEARSEALSVIRAGVSGSEVYSAAADVFERLGFGTERSAPAGSETGCFIHGLGHGVGLELHEPPSLSGAAGPLVSGDVVTVEPGLYRPDFGGYRVEDMVLVTDDGYELLTNFDHNLEV